MRTVKADFSQMNKLADTIKELGSKKNVNAFIEKEIKVLGAGLQTACIEHTPVKTGELRRNWKVTPAQRITNGQTIEVYNDLFYAGYVNDGHRIRRNGKDIGFYDGQHFMETANMEFTYSMEEQIKKDMESFIEEGLNGKN